MSVFRRIGLAVLFCACFWLPAAARTGSSEASDIMIRGSKTITFTARDLEGTKEGFVPGNLREENLRLNISGTVEGTEINASLINTSTAGTTSLAQNEDKISFLIRRASTEVYLGDFNADLNETEFTGLDKVLSGARARGDYGHWGFAALYSSPQGRNRTSRRYGDGTQGPYQLGAAPVVIDSERVSVDGRAQKRGDDYTIDYPAGTVTFIRKMIGPDSVVGVEYDSRESIYRHTTYGLRLTGRPWRNASLGAVYLNDTDSLSGAAAVSGEVAKPVGHYVVGVDGALVSELLTASGEVAYSSRDPDLLSAGQEQVGRAAKLDAASQLGPFGLKVYGKKVGRDFRAIADAAPKQSLTQYGGGWRWRPGPLLGGSGDYGYEKYTLDGVACENSCETAKTQLTPAGWPSLEYGYFLGREKSDPVTGLLIERRIVRHSFESLWRTGWLAPTFKAIGEDRLDQAPSAETRTFERFNLGLATAGLDNVSLASNVELERCREPDGKRQSKKTYIVNLSASPDRRYAFAGSVQQVDDSALGSTNSTDLSYRAEPAPFFQTEGKYTVQSLREEFATTEAVSKQAGSFSCDLRPVEYLRARYLYKPSFTLLARTGGRTANNELRQIELNFVPFGALLLGLICKEGHSFHVDRQAAPDYRKRSETSDTGSTLYTLKMAPFQIFSAELNYLLENGTTNRLVSAEPVSYLPGRNLNSVFEAVVKASLGEQWALDSRYTYQRTTRGSGEARDNLVDLVSRTAALKGTWNITEAWSVSLSGAYARTTDRLAVTPVSDTVTGGWGLVFRQGDRLRLELDYAYSKAMTSFSLRARYGVSDHVNVSCRALREFGRQPDYRLLDISLNVEINL